MHKEKQNTDKKNVFHEENFEEYIRQARGSPV